MFAPKNSHRLEQMLKDTEEFESEVVRRGILLNLNLDSYNSAFVDDRRYTNPDRVPTYLPVYQSNGDGTEPQERID